jgi:hypothetical protein
MKRFAPLLLVVVALAAVPAALADGTPAPRAGQQHVRLEILRLRLQLVHLRYRVVCHTTDSDACSTFTQKVTDRLTTLDGNVRKKLDELQCTADSTDKGCAVLAKLDERIQKALSKLRGGGGSSDESGLDAAAGAVAGTTP